MNDQDLQDVQGDPAGAEPVVDLEPDDAAADEVTGGKPVLTPKIPPPPPPQPVPVPYPNIAK